MPLPSQIKENRVFAILKTFDRKDLRLFGRFITSPYRNRHEEVTRFYKYLIGFHPHMNHPSLGKDKLFQKFFPGEKHNDKRIRYLFTDLARLLEKYMVYEQLERKPMVFKQILLEDFKERNLEGEFRKLFKEWQNSALDPANPVTRHYHLFSAGEMYLDYMHPRQSRKKESPIDYVIQQLDLFYISKKLELSCETVNVQALLNKNHQPFLLDALLLELQSHVYSREPVVAVYISILQTLREPDNERAFQLVLAKLKQEEKHFTRSQLRELYQYPLNFCIRQINKGNLLYQQTIFEIYKVILKNEVILPAGILSPWDYKNIVTVSLRLGHFNWSKSFLTEYKKFLPDSERENSFQFNMANYYFQKKDFPSALKLLQSVEFSDPVYQLDSRSILLKIYAEQDDQDALFYHLKAFQTFLDRNKRVSRFHKTLYGNLIRYTKKMIKVAGNKKEMEKLQALLALETNAADLPWLKKMLGTYAP